MEKTAYQTVYGTKIYPINYLMNAELTEADLNALLDKNNKGFTYSLIIGMFRHIKSNKKNYQIIKMCCNDDNWMNKNYWTELQRKEYESKISKVYKNIYQFGEEQSKYYAEWFTTVYGLTLKNDK